MPRVGELKEKPELEQKSPAHMLHTPSAEPPRTHHLLAACAHLEIQVLKNWF